MRLLPKSRSTPAKDVAPSPRTSLDVFPGNSVRSLDFWYIKPHDRKTLIDDIMPYMAGQLPNRYLLQTVLDRQTWTEELVKSELTTEVGDDVVYLNQTITAFWMDPPTMIVDLLRLTRLWFFMLLRYTYRTCFFEGRNTSRSDLDTQELCTYHNHHYASELTGDAAYRLTCVQNKYGASFYRKGYKDAKQRLGWTRFCARIWAFCKLTGLQTSSDNPEKNLQELRYNLTSIVMHRSWSQINHQLNKNTVLVRSTGKEVKKLDERVVSDGVRNLKVMEEMRREIADLQIQFDKLRLAYPPRSELQQWDTKFSSEIKKCRLSSEMELARLRRNVQTSDMSSQQLIANLNGQVEKLRTDLNRPHVLEGGKLTAESLIIYRWLLEHLPAPKLKNEGLGWRWKQFWQHEWTQCENKIRRADHPLWKLTGEKKYNKVGKNLYGTLSNRLHGYGHQWSDGLHPDVQRVLDAIKPVHYYNDGKVDLDAERNRWLN